MSNEAQVKRFRDEVAESHGTDKIHLLFNNAGIGGGGSMFAHSREEWEKTFNVCWGGVYNCTRAFLLMMQKAEEGHIVNTSSVNGFWASVGPRIPHTAYSAAKFAVKGFRAWRLVRRERERGGHCEFECDLCLFCSYTDQSVIFIQALRYESTVTVTCTLDVGCVFQNACLDC